MLKRLSGLVTLALMLCMAGAWAAPAAAAANPDVVMFDVEGNAQVPAEKILGAISNTRIGAPFDSQKAEADGKAILALGYFSDVHIRTEGLLDGIKVIFQVVENPVLKEVRLLGLTKVRPEELQPFFTQKPGEVFNAAIFRDDLARALRDCREKKGLFIEPRTSRVGISADGIVQVELVEFKYGKIIIRGLEKTKEIVVRRELTIREGEIIDYNALKEDYMTLMRLRLFDNVDPHLEKSATPDAYDVIFDFKEAQTGSFSFGVSFGENDGEVGGVLGYSEANLMGLGQNIAIDLDYSESENNASFTFTEPWIDDKNTSFSLSMWNSDSYFSSTLKTWYPADSTPYYIHLVETGLSLSLGRPVGKDLRGQVKLSVQRDSIPDIYTDSSEDEKAPISGSDIEFWDNSVGLSLIKNKLRYQDRNFVDGGYQWSTDYTVAGQYFGGDFDYQKGTLEGKWFHSFSPDLVWGNRLQAVGLTGDYPDFSALYLGGMNRLRGFNDRRYSSEMTQSLIGDRYLMANTELRYRLPSNKSLEFVLFYDAGQIRNLDGGSSNAWDYGIGLRYNLPMLGVIRLDQAWNSQHDTKLVFSMGEMF
jgi:outer membrane protein insertion porin family